MVQHLMLLPVVKCNTGISEVDEAVSDSLSYQTCYYNTVDNETFVNILFGIYILIAPQAKKMDTVSRFLVEIVIQRVISIVISRYKNWT